MVVINNLEEALLCNFEASFNVTDLPPYITSLWKCNWESLLNDDIIKNVLSSNLVLNTDVIRDSDGKYKIIAIAAANLLAFCQANFTGPDFQSVENIIADNWPESINAANLLVEDSVELNAVTSHKELLLVATKLLTSLNDFNDSPLVSQWWLLRCLLIHQRSLDELSNSLYERILACIEKLDKLLKLLIDDYEINKSVAYTNSQKLAVLLNLEISQAFLTYSRVNKAEVYLKNAGEVAGVTLTISGAMGKRTQYQQKDVAQLSLQVTLNSEGHKFTESAAITHGGHIPELLKHNDDVRLEAVLYTEGHHMAVVPAVEQAFILNTLDYKKRSQPKDSLAEEELQPYIHTLLSQADSPWSVRINTLLILANIECRHKRTVERSMRQVEDIVAIQTSSDTNVNTRLSYIFATGLLTRWQTRSQLADLLLNLGLVKNALDIYLEIQLWEEVIVCYTLLELKHKAAEIIRERINVKPTVKLYCLLGDATDDVSCYEKAWEMSNYRSGRAQRHWGNYFFAKRNYSEAVPHYEISLEINSLQEVIWLKLGYASLTIENWELAAKAYRRYTNLEAHGFEAWNNLAKAYIKLGNKNRAHKIIIEALKCNYDNWQVWENMVLISVDTNNFNDAVRGYERLIELRGKHLDLEVLEILTNVIVNEKKDAEGNSAGNLLSKFQKLIAHLCSLYPTEPKLFIFYATLPLAPSMRTQKLLLAYRAYTQGTSWKSDPVICLEVIELSFSLAESVKEVIEQMHADNVAEKTQMLQQLSSVRLTCQSAYSAISQARFDCAKVNDKLPELKKQVEILTEECKKYAK